MTSEESFARYEAIKAEEYPDREKDREEWEAAFGDAKRRQEISKRYSAWRDDKERRENEALKALVPRVGLPCTVYFYNCMKETTTTIVTTEVTRRAPKKKTIVGADHIVSDGRAYIVEHHASRWPGESKGIPRVSAQEAKVKMRAGISNSMGPKQTEGRMCLATSLLHLSAIRNGLCDIASHPDLSLLDNDDCERLQIIAVQLNEFIPILREIMTKRVSLFANYQFPAF